MTMKMKMSNIWISKRGSEYPKIISGDFRFSHNPSDEMLKNDDVQSPSKMVVFMNISQETSQKRTIWNKSALI